MESKLRIPLYFGYDTETFNRTSMELKRTLRMKGYESLFTFNRTSMELKHDSVFPHALHAPTFNRTSMELKRYHPLQR